MVLPHPVIVDFLDVPEPVPGKIFMYTFQERDLVGKERMLVFHGLTSDGKGFIIRNLRIVFAVLIRTGYLAPVHLPSLIRFTMEHVRVDAADRWPVFIDPAPAIFEEPAGSITVVLCPQRIPGDIKYTVLVAELGLRGRFDRGRIEGPDTGHFAIDQKNMAVERAGAASGATDAPETYPFYHLCEAIHRICEETALLLLERGDTVRDGYERNGDHAGYAVEYSTTGY